MQIKQKPTNKTKTSEQKTIKATIFCAGKLLNEGKSLILHFGAFCALKSFCKKKNKKKKTELKLSL